MKSVLDSYDAMFDWMGFGRPKTAKNNNYTSDYEIRESGINSLEDEENERGFEGGQDN